MATIIVASSGRRPCRLSRHSSMDLELDGMGGEIGHVETRKRFDRRFGIVVGRAADQREPGKVDDRIDRGLAILR